MLGLAFDVVRVLHTQSAVRSASVCGYSGVYNASITEAAFRYSIRFFRLMHMSNDSQQFRRTYGLLMRKIKEKTNHLLLIKNIQYSKRSYGKNMNSI